VLVLLPQHDWLECLFGWTNLDVGCSAWKVDVDAFNLETPVRSTSG
jgi:hypothetical protein